MEIDQTLLWQAIAAIATILAAFATLLAAYFNFRLTSKWQHKQQIINQKLIIFANIMQDRAEPVKQDWVRAFNLIDVVFHDADEVRCKWGDLYDYLIIGASTGEKCSCELKNKRNALLKAMAEDIDYGKNLSDRDFDRYFRHTPL